MCTPGAGRFAQAQSQQGRPCVAGAHWPENPGDYIAEVAPVHLRHLSTQPQVLAKGGGGRGGGLRGSAG